MNSHEPFWQIVHDALDTRRDPLDAIEVQEYLEAHPELLDEFADLNASVQVLAHAPRADAAPRKRWIAGLAAATLLVTGAALVVVFWPDSKSDTRLDPGSIELPDLATTGEVLSFEVRSLTTGPNGTTDYQTRSGVISIQENRVHTYTQPRVATPHGHAISTERTVTRSFVRPEHINEQP